MIATDFQRNSGPWTCSLSPVPAPVHWNDARTHPVTPLHHCQDTLVSYPFILWLWCSFSLLGEVPRSQPPDHCLCRDSCHAPLSSADLCMDTPHQSSVYHTLGTAIWTRARPTLPLSTLSPEAYIFWLLRPTQQPPLKSQHVSELRLCWRWHMTFQSILGSFFVFARRMLISQVNLVNL